MANGSEIGIAVGVVLGVLLLLFLWIFSMSCYVVKQAEAIIIERLGKFNRVLESGIHFVIPFIDSPRPFTWRKTFLQFGVIKDEVITNYRIDMRESVFNFLPQEVYTKDTVLVNINSLMYYRIYDVMKAVYEVDDLQIAISNTAQTQLKEVFGNMTFSEALESQHAINQHLSKEFSKLFYEWGIQVERMELLDLSPTMGIQNNMKKQMMAERARRGEFIRSEGKKSAMRLKAEGTKGVTMNMGLAKQEATRKRSEGEYESMVLMSTAERNSLELLSNSFQRDDTNQSQFLLARKFIDLTSNVIRSAADSHLFLPYEISSIAGMLHGNILRVFGKNSEKPGNGAGAAESHAPSRRAPSPPKRFKELD
eukprot:comp19019_c0_seq1/m.35126 comp19019_c0_seq1/g.35126  ORF comp19019_c0_seq1/g.35126 comp19019_c0_seq1/m.35126 type:complete len:366 (+) comp19019_c0_seq1:837-1934(+)